MQFNKADIERAKELVANGEVRETIRRNRQLNEDTDILVAAIEIGLIEMNKEAN